MLIKPIKLAGFWGYLPRSFNAHIKSYSLQSSHSLVLSGSIMWSWPACNVRVKLGVVSALSVVSYRLLGHGRCTSMNLGQ